MIQIKNSVSKFNSGLWQSRVQLKSSLNLGRSEKFWNICQSPGPGHWALFMQAASTFSHPSPSCGELKTQKLKTWLRTPTFDLTSLILLRTNWQSNNNFDKVMNIECWIKISWARLGSVVFRFLFLDWLFIVCDDRE